MSYSKIGAFALPTYGGQIEDIVNTGMRVFKTFDHTQAQLLLNLRGPGLIVISRTTLDDDLLRWMAKHPDPLEMARAWVDEAWPQLIQTPGAYTESFNEPGAWWKMPEYGLFEAERQRLMWELGIERLGHPLHACIGNFGGGSPPLPEDSWPNAWADFSPALAACHKYRNLLGVHEYGGLCLSLWYGPNQSAYIRSGKWDVFPDTAAHIEGYLVGRYRKVWNQIIEPNGWTDIRMVCTEAGWDRVGTVDTDWLTGGKNVGPIKDILDHRYWESPPFSREDGSQFAFEQIRWQDYLYRATPYMVGFTMFGWAASDDVIWDDWDLHEYPGIERRVLEHIALSKHPEQFRAVRPVEGLNLRTRIGKFTKGVLPHSEIIETLDESGGWSLVRREAGLQPREGWVVSEHLARVDY